MRLYKQLRNVIKISFDCKGVVRSPRFETAYKAVLRHEKAILEGLIRDGIKSGLFRKDVDPATIATIVSTMLVGVLARSFFLKDFDMQIQSRRLSMRSCFR